MKEPMKIIINSKKIEEAQKLAEQHVVKFINEIPNNVKALLNGALADYLGVKKSFGKIEFRDNGTLMKKLISQKAQQVVTKLINNLVWEPNEDELKEIRAAALETYSEEVRNGIHWAMRDLAKDKVERWKEEFLEIDIDLSGFKPVNKPTVEELSNPKYGDSPLQKILIEAQLEEKLEE